MLLDGEIPHIVRCRRYDRPLAALSVSYEPGQIYSKDTWLEQPKQGRRKTVSACDASLGETEKRCVKVFPIYDTISQDKEKAVQRHPK
jgi:hypothetical protein